MGACSLESLPRISHRETGVPRDRTYLGSIGGYCEAGHVGEVPVTSYDWAPEGNGCRRNERIRRILRVTCPKTFAAKSCGIHGQLGRNFDHPHPRYKLEGGGEILAPTGERPWHELGQRGARESQFLAGRLEFFHEADR